MLVYTVRSQKRRSYRVFHCAGLPAYNTRSAGRGQKMKKGKMALYLTKANDRPMTLMPWISFTYPGCRLRHLPLLWISHARRRKRAPGPTVLFRRRLVLPRSWAELLFQDSLGPWMKEVAIVYIHYTRPRLRRFACNRHPNKQRKEAGNISNGRLNGSSLRNRKNNAGGMRFFAERSVESCRSMSIVSSSPSPI